MHIVLLLTGDHTLMLCLFQNYTNPQNCYTFPLQDSKLELLCSLILPELYNLDSLNLDSCKIGDEDLSHLKG
jgi:hypothetical protein